MRTTPERITSSSIIQRASPRSCRVRCARSPTAASMDGIWGISVACPRRIAWPRAERVLTACVARCHRVRGGDSDGRGYTRWPAGYMLGMQATVPDHGSPVECPCEEWAKTPLLLEGMLRRTPVQTAGPLVRGGPGGHGRGHDVVRVSEETGRPENVDATVLGTSGEACT